MSGTFNFRRFDTEKTFFWNYIVADSQFGSVLIAELNGKITHLLIKRYANFDHLKLRISQYLPAGAEVSILFQKTDILSNAEKQFMEYAAGKRREFSLPLAPQGTPFQLKVWSALCDIPYGERATYGEIARKIDLPKGARAVGGAVHRNPIAVIIPCHRVVAVNGLGGFAVGLDLKKRLLAIEAD